MKKIILTMLITLLTTTLVVGCGNFSERQSKNLQATTNNAIENYNNTDENIMLEPTIPQCSLEQSTGADQPWIDYASDDIVIFHGIFGLFVYDLNKLNIKRSLDLKPIKCNSTQGDAYCNVEVSKDGNIVQLHAINSKKMYIYSVPDNTLCETNYSPMENSFPQRVEIEIEGKTVDNHIEKLNYYAVQFDSGEYGYLTSGHGTIGEINYVRGDKIYSLFKSV